MKKYCELSFMEVYDQFFMQGSNLGNKINAKQRNARLTLDMDLKVVAVLFKDKASAVPLQSIKSFDWAEIPDDLKEHWGLNEPKKSAEPAVPPAMRRGRKPAVETQAETTEPVDEDALARHRAEVRARSANAYKNQQIVQNDSLIQQTRGQAMGFSTNAQVNNPTRPTEGASVVGKTKALSHAQLNAQLAQEAKDVKPQ